MPRQYNPAGTAVTKAGNKITIALGLIDFLAIPPTNPLNWPIGELPAGSCQVEVR